MDLLLLFLYLAYLVGLGHVWWRTLLPDAAATSRGWVGPLSWGFCLGTIVWGYGQFLLNVFNLPTHGAWLLSWQGGLVAAPLLISAIRYDLSAISYESWTSSFRNVNNHSSEPISHSRYFIVFFLALALLTAVLQALSLPMHMWDSIVIYGFKAKILFLEQTFKTDAFMDPNVIHYSADYPLLTPYLEAGFYRWLGHPDDRLIRLLFVAYGAAWMGILYEGLASRVSQRTAALVILIVATLPLFSNAFMGQAASGFADIPLALYWTAFLVAPRRLLPLLVIGCAFTKSEGLPLVLIGAWARREIGLSLSGLLLLSPWWWVRHHLPHNAAHYLRWMSWSAPLLLENLRMIVWSVGREFLHVKSWGLFWFMAVGGALWPRRDMPWPSDAKRLLVAAALQLGVYGYVYLSYPQDLGLLIPITLPRLLIHLVGPLTLAGGWRLAD